MSLISPRVFPSSCPLNQWCYPIISSSATLFSFAFTFFQHQGLFQWVGSSHQMAKIMEFQLQHQSFQWNSGLISSRIDWFDLLAVQGTLKSLFQHHNSKPLIFLHSSFFIIQLSHLYTTIKRPQLWLHRLWQKTYASSYMTLSWFVIAFLPEESIF